jgi:organic radical activating enzyme
MFVSLQGEGPYAGAVTVFVRFAGCNRVCRYCDTARWRSTRGAREMPVREVAARAREMVERSGAEFIALTGGEPTLQPGFACLVGLLHSGGARVYVETNASRPSRLEAACRTGGVGVVAVNLKLPSDDRYGRDTVAGALRCGRIAARYRVEWFLKVVVTRLSVDSRSVALLRRVVRGSGVQTLVLQPETLRGAGVRQRRDVFIATTRLLREVRPEVRCIMVVPQLHRTVARLR